MSPPAPLRDAGLLDALEALAPVPFDGTMWRVVRDGREVLQPSSFGGRWDDGTFEVLYTSLERDGALSEMRFHLYRGQPVLPSKVAYRLFQLRVSLARVLEFASLDTLSHLGLDPSRYGALAYKERAQEYPSTQVIAEAAHFMNFDGLIVPSARAACLNMIVFTDRVSPDALSVAEDHGLVEWEKAK